MRFFSLLFLIIILVSCSPFKSGQKAKDNRPMTDEEKQEFSYAFTEATKQHLFGNYKQAVSLYLKCIQYNPRSAASYFQLSNIFSMAENKTEAISFARSAVEIDKTNFWYLAQLASLYQAIGAKDSTIEVYKLIVKNDPNKYDLRYELALLYIDNEDYKNALIELNNIEEAIGISEQTSIAKHQIFVIQKKFEKAEDELYKVIAQNPTEIKYYGILAEMFGDLGLKDKALAAYQKIFTIDPENEMGLFSITEFYLALKDSTNARLTIDKIVKSKKIELDDKIKSIGNLLNNIDQFQLLKNYIKNWVLYIINDYPDDYQPNSLLTNYFIKSEDYHSAVNTLISLVEKQKDNGIFWEQLLYMENMLQRNDSLIAHADTALKYFPKEPSFYLLKGIALYQKSRYNDAIITLKTGLQYAQEKDQIIQFNTFLGESNYKIEKFLQSETYFDKVLELDPVNVYVLNNYAYYLSLLEKNLEKAEEMAEKAVALEPENSTYLDTYAWVLYKRKNFGKAKVIIEKAFKNGGQDNSEITEHLADILYCNGDIEKAMEFWRISITLGQNRDAIEKKMMGYRCK